MTTEIPEEITTPDKVETAIGDLEFFDGVPSKQTVKTLYDNLDRMRGVQTFLAGYPAVSAYALYNGVGASDERERLDIAGMSRGSRWRYRISGGLEMVPGVEMREIRDISHVSA